jgi:hypothetical protein
VADRTDPLAELEQKPTRACSTPGAAGRSARRARDGARRHCIRALLEWRSDRDGDPAVGGSSQTDRPLAAQLTAVYSCRY